MSATREASNLLTYFERISIPVHLTSRLQLFSFSIWDCSVEFMAEIQPLVTIITKATTSQWYIAHGTSIGWSHEILIYRRTVYIKLFQLHRLVSYCFIFCFHFILDGCSCTAVRTRIASVQRLPKCDSEKRSVQEIYVTIPLIWQFKHHPNDPSSWWSN